MDGRLYRKGFSIVEVLVIVLVIGLLAGVAVFGLGAWQQRTAENTVKSDLLQASSGLTNYQNFNDGYPPNLAGTGFAASQGVALTLLTNAPSIGVYENLTGPQNAQLFLNACNANVFTTPNNTACTFQGNGNGAKVHVKGTVSSNAIWNSPINRSDVTLSCGANQSACNQATADMISQFESQGGSFPVTISGQTAALPTPTEVPNGNADRYCLEGRSASYPSVVLYITHQTSSPVEGNCPADPTLRYYP